MPLRTRSPSERFLYQLVPQTPPLDAREVDGEGTALEVVVIWGAMSILHVAHLSPPRAFHVGGDERSDDFVIGEETLGCARLTLVSMESGEPRLVLARGGQTVLERAGERHTLEAPEHTRHIPLALGDCARISHGALTFVVRAVAAARPEFAAVRAKPSLRGSRWTLASAAAHLCLLVAFYFLPPASGVLALDRLETSSRLVQFAIDAHEQVEPPPRWLEAKPGPAAPGGESAPDVEGRAGPRRPHPGPAPRPEHPAPPADVNDTGILPLLRNSLGTLPGGAFTAASANGRDGQDAIGTALAGLGGGSGFGMIGTGRGGGGNANGAIGSGGLGTRGIGSGSGGYGSGGGALHEHVARVPRIRSGQPDLHGSLAKETIRRVIGQHINEVRHCYEQQLISQPDLSGRVAVKFIIAPTGAVQTAVVDASSDLGSPAAESCIAQAVRRWLFPQPEGGGVVIVTYPFLLSQTGG